MAKNAADSEGLHNAITKVLWWLALIAFGLFLLWILNRPPIPSEIAANQAAYAVAQKITSGASNPTWQSVEIKKVTAGDYELEIVYRTVPSSYDDVESDTKQIVRAVLSALRATGMHAARIMVFTRRDVRGETGKNLVQDFGYASYNDERDLIVFKRP